MEKINIFYLFCILGIFACACSQILLKKSADRSHKSFLKSMLNWRVVLAYAIFFGSLFINITGMSNGVRVKDIPILESLGYIFVPVLSMIFLKEKITKNVFVSMLFILVGVIVFYM